LAGGGTGGGDRGGLGSTLRAALQRVVRVEDGEIPLMVSAAALFFCVIGSNYVIRPLREQLGTRIDEVSWLFVATLAGTLLLNPPFALLVSKYSRRVFIPVVYRTVAATLLLAFALLVALPEAAGLVVGRVFFVWASVYNLLIVSVFWGFMADVFRSEQGKRLFGFIAVGGSLGGIVGAVIATQATWIGSYTLLLFSAGALELSLYFLRRISRRVPEASPAGPRTLAHPWRDMAQGFRLLGRSTYLQGIALYITFYAISSTLLWFEQREIVKAGISDVDERTSYFAWIETSTNVVSLVFQAFVTGRLLPRLGLFAGLLVIPTFSIVGLLSLELWPGLVLLFIVQVIRRASEYGISKPAREVLWTVTARDERYVAKQLVDVPIYRAGDAVGAWWGILMTALGLGLRGMTVTFLPVVALWVGLAHWLSRRQAALAAAREGPAR
jgi:AAA family ATP:ADP antiporter